MKSWLKNDIEMYSTLNEGQSAVGERYIRTIKNKIYKYMTSISKNVYIDQLDDIVYKFPARVQLPPICRGELSAVIARLMSKCM